MKVLAMQSAMRAIELGDASGLAEAVIAALHGWKGEFEAAETHGIWPPNIAESSKPRERPGMTSQGMHGPIPPCWLPRQIGNISSPGSGLSNFRSNDLEGREIL